MRCICGRGPDPDNEKTATLKRQQDGVPLVGARRRDQLSESLGALDLNPTAEDLARIERAVPPGAAAGDRYSEPQMAHLDSERSRASGK